MSGRSTHQGRLPRPADTASSTALLDTGLLGLAPDPMIVVDGDGVIVQASEQIEALTGYSRDQLSGLSVDTLLPDGLRSAHRAHRAAFLAAPSRRPMATHLDVRLRHSSGAEVPVEVSLSPADGASGPLVVASIRDVSARARAESALRESETRLAEAQRIARIGSWSWSVESDWSAGPTSCTGCTGSTRRPVRRRSPTTSRASTPTTVTGWRRRSPARWSPSSRTSTTIASCCPAVQYGTCTPAAR